MRIYEELIPQKEYNDNNDGLCDAFDRTDDNEESHYNDDNNDDDTRYMVHDDAWWSQYLWCSVTEGSKPVRITLFHMILISERSKIS